MDIDNTLSSAVRFHQKGDFQQAESLYRKVLEKQSDNPDALHMLGLLCCQFANYDAAICYISKALQCRPTDVAGAYCHLGIALQGKGLLDEAIYAYEKALEINPFFAEAYCNLGYTLQEKGLVDEAIFYYQKALQVNPSLVEAYGNLGYAFVRKGLLDESILCSQKAIALNSHYASAYCNLGLALKGKKQFDEAIACYQNAIAINPSFVQAYCNLGAVYQEKEQFNQAVDCYHKAIALNPNFDTAYNNIGLILHRQGMLDEAVSWYRKAVALNPDFADAHYNMSFALLLSGNFQEGWQEYEWRWKTKDFVPHCREFNKPLWLGQRSEGFTVLLHAEQGLGDTLQFVRYIPLVAQRGVKIVFECYRELRSLLENIHGIHQILAKGERIPDFDMHCPLLTLPLVFQTTKDTIPAETPYITVSPPYLKKWESTMQRFPSHIRVGLVWSGNPKYGKDQDRSLSPRFFSSFASTDGIVFYSLQKGHAAVQRKEFPQAVRPIDFTDEIHDFSDTAAIIQNLDLVISVDTAVAHLAGALGKPVWTLLPFAPDWRWMLDREDSPWYPTMRLFRQPAPGDWGAVIERVAQELRVFKESNGKG